jgi:hypothetical protein
MKTFCFLLVLIGLCTSSLLKSKTSGTRCYNTQDAIDGPEILKFPDLDYSNFPPKDQSTCTVAWYKMVQAPVTNTQGSIVNSAVPVVNTAFVKSLKGKWKVETTQAAVNMNYKIQCCIETLSSSTLKSSYLKSLLLSLAFFAIFLF